MPPVENCMICGSKDEEEMRKEGTKAARTNREIPKVEYQQFVRWNPNIKHNAYDGIWISLSKAPVTA